MTTINAEQFDEALREELASYGRQEISLLGSGEKEFSGRIDLTLSQEKQLAQRMFNLPQDAVMVILGIHYFGFTPNQTDKIFNLSHSKGRVLFYIEMLSSFMGLPDNYIISEASMEHSCLIYMRHYFADLERKYRPFHYTGRRLLQSVAILILVFATAIATRFTVDATFRERVVIWVMEHFEKYSELRLIDENKTEFVDESIWKGEYLPDNFYLDEKIESENTIMYTYRTSDNRTLNVLLTSSDAVSQIDTENKILDERLINDEQVVFVWGDDVNQVILSHKGYQYHLMGEISEDELEKIAVNILK